jgi:hypothetical protein
MQTLWEQFLELLRTDPAFRAEVRRLVLTDELLALPEKVDELVKAVQELVAVQREHSEILRRHEEILREHSEILRQHSEILRQHSERLAALAEAQKRTEEQLAALAEAQKRTEEQLAALMEAQKRTEEQVSALAEAQKRMEEQLAALTEAQRRTEEQLAALVEDQRRMWEELRRLVAWQQGEAGRREGEQYERQVIRRAPAIFNGGQGGPPDQPFVQQKLTDLLSPFWREGLMEPDDDPLLSDLIWWKSVKMLVVEASLQVDRYDVERAARRSATLRRAGADAVGVVIGKAWATPEAWEMAMAQGVEWFIGSDMSDGFRQFRQTPA